MTAFRELTESGIEMRIHANRRLPELDANSIDTSGWEPAIFFRNDRSIDLHHQEIVLRETQITKSGRFLPLHTIGLTNSQKSNPNFGYSYWYMFPNHPIPEVREETLQAARNLRDGVLQLEARGLVEVTFVISLSVI